MAKRRGRKARSEIWRPSRKTAELRRSLRLSASFKLTIRGGELGAAILAGLQTRLMEPERFQKFAADFVAEINRQRMTASAAKSSKEAALAKVERQIKRLVDAIADGAEGPITS